jgi:capsular polysaccharide biosynthesis protein
MLKRRSRVTAVGVVARSTVPLLNVINIMPESIRDRVRGAFNGALDYSLRHDTKLGSLLVFIWGLKRGSSGCVRLLPIEWLDENTNGFRMSLEAEVPGWSFGPNIQGHQCVERVLLPAVNLYSFENVHISAMSSSVLVGNKLLVEHVKGVDPSRCSFVSGHLSMHGPTRAVVTVESTERLKKGIFMGGNGASNYYHWMIEILPKLQFVRNIDAAYPTFPLLVSEGTYRVRSLREGLEVLAKERPVVVLDRNKTYAVNELVYVSNPNNSPFNLRRGERSKVSDFITRPSSIGYLRNRLTSALGKGICHGGERVFLARRSERRKYNQDEILKICADYGFKSVFMDEKSLSEQAELISNAEIIAGPTGAAWTNLMFCRAGAKGLCWMAEESAGFSAFSNLARAVDADLRYVTYCTGAKSTEDLFMSDYHVDGNKIRAELDTLLG